ncbi:MAG: hypothetical protein AAF211_04145, partial [Myxococcota bacterium]
MIPIDQRETVLLGVLGAGGLTVDLAPGPQGPIATFEMELANEDWVQMSAQVIDDAVRIDVQSVLPWDGTDELLRWCLVASDDWGWGWGALFRAGATDRIDAALSLYAAEQLPDRAWMYHVRTHLADAVDAIRQRRMPYYRPPPPAPPIAVAKLGQALVDLGVTHRTPKPELFTAEYVLDGIPIVVAFYLFDGSMLQVRAQVPKSWAVPDA